jgi:pimeloyl-ACP methyl ester carboxylesterase
MSRVIGCSVTLLMEKMIYLAPGSAMNCVVLHTGFLAQARRVVFTVSALCFACAAAASMAFGAEKNTSVIENPAYIHAQRLVEVESGRRLNLYCLGTGSPTVVFDSGLGDGTEAWALVQPVIAAHTRACSYDRAGYGYSDPGTHEASSAHIVDDLHRLLVAASIKPPYVLVGHSFGGMNVRLYADLYPADVVGMVLVDSAEEDWRETYWQLDPKQQTRAQDVDDEEDFQARLDCVKAAAVGLREGTEAYRNCVPDPDPHYSAQINAAYAKVYRLPAYQQATFSEQENLYHESAGQVRAARRWYADMPLIVLTSSPRKPGTHETQALRDAFNRAHAFHADQLAALSTRGVVRPVPDSDHMIQMSQPDAVNAAILEVLKDATMQK